MSETKTLRHKQDDTIVVSTKYVARASTVLVLIRSLLGSCIVSNIFFSLVNYSGREEGLF
jgi:hypothetical protein